MANIFKFEGMAIGLVYVVEFKGGNCGRGNKDRGITGAKDDVGDLVKNCNQDEDDDEGTE